MPPPPPPASPPLTRANSWHEHDPDELLRSVHRCLAGAFEAFARRGHARAAIRAVGISTQRETTVCWDTATGRALCNALVWTDTRTAGIARELAARARAADVPLQDVCGLPVSAYPSVTKLVWMLRNVDGVRAALEAGTLAFGTVDAWLVYWLNGGPAADVFVTEPTNASRTMFMDLHTLRYSERMLDFFSDAAGVDLRKVRMPSIVRSAHATAFGKLATGPLQGLRITACLGDQSAALVGQKGLHAGCAKNTYGTGCFLLYNVGDTPVISTHGLLATVAYVLDDKPMYALEGSIAVAGSGVRFLTGESTSPLSIRGETLLITTVSPPPPADNLGFEEKSHQISELAETVPDNGGLVFVTAFSGLFAPYWIDDARGTICENPPRNMSRSSSRARLTAPQSASPATQSAATSRAPPSRPYASRHAPSSTPCNRTRAGAAG